MYVCGDTSTDLSIMSYTTKLMIIWDGIEILEMEIRGNRSCEGLRVRWRRRCRRNQDEGDRGGTGEKSADMCTNGSCDVMGLWETSLDAKEANCADMERSACLPVDRNRWI